MRWKTVAGLTIVAAVGIGSAMLFRQGPRPSPASPTPASSAPPLAAERPRGSIVPLPGGERRSPTAFISADAIGGSEDAATADAGQRPTISHIPTIRRDDRLKPNEPAPRLERRFPAPLALLGIEPLGLDEEPPRQPPEEISNTESGSRKNMGVEKPGRPIRHTIVDGDTLPNLAARFLGDADRAMEIYTANRHMLPSPDLLPIGAKIVIPPR